MKMNKLLALTLAVFMLLSLVACDNTPPEVNNDNNNTVSGNNSEAADNGNDTEKGNENSNTSFNSINADNIVFSSPFYEGLAFVAIKDDPYTAYCINKSGETIFKIEDCSKDNTERGIIELGLRFQNGLMLFDGNIYDTSGKVTTPEALGVTSFIEWDGTFLFAEKITSDYASAAKELGVLNKNFEWELSLSETNYAIYQEDQYSFYNLLDLPEAERDDQISIIGDSVYAGFEELFSAEELGVQGFYEIWDNRYVVAYTRNMAGVGILSLDGEWILEPSNDLKWLYKEAPDWFQEQLLNNKEGERSCVLVNSKIYVNNGTIITAEDLAVDRILQANNDYILVQVREDAGVSGILKCVGIMDYSHDWIVEPTSNNYDSCKACDDIYFSGHYMVMNINGELYYYDITNDVMLDQKPNDLPEQEESSKGEDDTDIDDEMYDITQITNYRMSTDFVDGKAAVLLLNPDTNELFVTIVGLDMEFVFEPQKLDVKNCLYPSLEFDGTHIVFFDNYNGTAQYPLGIYVYNANGEKVTTLSTSIFEIDNSTSITCDYSEGIFVLSFNYGTYSAYYRKSTVKYYSIDGTPFEW